MTARARLLAMAGPSAFTYDGREVRQMRSPMVYAWLQHDELLYVGVGTRGLSRPLSHGHPKIGFLGGDDTLLVWIYSSAEAAVAAEAQLIKDLQPKLNGQRGPYVPAFSSTCQHCRRMVEPQGICRSCLEREIRQRLEAKFRSKRMQLRATERLIAEQTEGKVWEFCPRCQEHLAKYATAIPQDYSI